MCEKFDGYFNLSSTFRSDSDITSIYFTNARLKWNFNVNFDENKFAFKNKRTGLAAALISACSDNIKRLDYINELKKYMPVDIYGQCSILKCPQKFDCRKFISDNYLFYFAFENSLCSEYVTEKFFTTLNYEIVPVVLGSGDYTKYIPSSGFINVLDYKSPLHLAEHLNYLSQNQTAYMQYFKWKQFIVRDENAPKYSIFCEMCIKLQLEQFTGVQKKYFVNHSSLFGMTHNCRSVTIREHANRKRTFYFNGTRDVKMKFFVS